MVQIPYLWDIMPRLVLPLSFAPATMRKVLEIVTYLVWCKYTCICTISFRVITMEVGYARVSTTHQAESLAHQIQTLEEQGCKKVFSDTASGVKADRPGLIEALAYLREGDTLVITRLDRLGRSAADTLATVRDLGERGVRVLALDVGLDTSTAGGRLFMNIATVLADWERELMLERVNDGLARARAQGRVGGRPKKLSADARQAAIAALEAGMSVKQVAQLNGVSRWTIQRLKHPN